MKRLLSILAFLPVAAGHFSATSEEISPRRPRPVNFTPALLPSSTNTAGAKPLKWSKPPLEEGVEDLNFTEFFRPVGPRGLEFTDRVNSLNGKRVRILGYMVHESEPLPGQFMLAPMPVQLHESEYGFCEDLPASVIFVSVPPRSGEVLPFVPKPLLLTGTLSVGNKPEANGRISCLWLTLDPAKTAGKPSPQAKNLDSAVPRP